MATSGTPTWLQTWNEIEKPKSLGLWGLRGELKERRKTNADTMGDKEFWWAQNGATLLAAADI